MTLNNNARRFFVSVFTLGVVFASSPGLAFSFTKKTEGCRPAASSDDKLTTDETINCFANDKVKFAVKTPDEITIDDLSAEMLAEGPNMHGLTDQELSSKKVYCRYKYHEKSQNSPKFRCFRTDSNGRFFNSQNEIVTEAVEALDADKKINGVEYKEGTLLDISGQPIAVGSEIQRGDEIKVKYLSTKVKSTSGNSFVLEEEIEMPRYREVFTEVVGTRLMWALGFPADNIYPVEKLICFGCNNHPFEQLKSTINMEEVRKSANPFGVIINYNAQFTSPIIERRYEPKKIGESWDFDVITKDNVVKNWTAEQKNDFEAMILAVSLINYYNPIAQQNRLHCESKPKDNQCDYPMAMIQDVGSTLGGDHPGLFNSGIAIPGLMQNPRGELSAFENGKIFANAATCQLGHAFGEVTHISNSGMSSFLARLNAADLTEEKVRAIFEASRIVNADPELRDTLGANVVLNRWVQAFMNHVQEVKSAGSCLEH